MVDGGWWLVANAKNDNPRTTKNHDPPTTIHDPFMLPIYMAQDLLLLMDYTGSGLGIRDSVILEVGSWELT
jgi:hypothetical protein